jgi:hypothetical protein
MIPHRLDPAFVRRLGMAENQRTGVIARPDKRVAPCGFTLGAFAGLFSAALPVFKPSWSGQQSVILGGRLVPTLAPEDLLVIMPLTAESISGCGWGGSAT